MKVAKSTKNIIFGLASQAIIIGLGLIVPRIILVNYGSDVNGYTSTIKQIFTYMALLEAGIGQSTLNSLYGPVAQNDHEKISHLMSASLKYYRKVTVFYGLLVIVMAFIMPTILNTNIKYSTAFWVIIFEGMSSVIGFYYLESWKQLLSADGRYYVIQNITMINTVGSYTVKIVLATIGVNIAVIQFGFFLLSLIQMIIYKIYCKKNYGWVDFNSSPNKEALKDRYSFMLSQIATTVFSSTDMIVLAVFGSTLYASVYSIYGLIYTNLNNLLNAVFFGLVYILGQEWKKNKETYVEIHDAFDGLSMWAITSTMSVAYILTMPFVRLYTNGISDIDYIYYELPLLFSLIQILSWSRYVSGNLTAVAGYAKPVSKISVIEASINLIGSIILVKRFGIVGTLLATVIALPLKIIYCMVCANKTIMKRGVFSSLKILIVNYSLFFGVVVFNRHFPINVNDFGSFIFKAVIVSLVIYPSFLVINCLTNKSIYKKMNKILRRFGRI